MERPRTQIPDVPCRGILPKCRGNTGSSFALTGDLTPSHPCPAFSRSETQHDSDVSEFKRRHFSEAANCDGNAEAVSLGLGSSFHEARQRGRTGGRPRKCGRAETKPEATDEGEMKRSRGAEGRAMGREGRRDLPLLHHHVITMRISTHFPQK